MHASPAARQKHAYTHTHLPNPSQRSPPHTSSRAQFLYHFDFSQPDYAALALLSSGFGLATLAANRLGLDRTYFGWELGEIKGDYVARFPYGVVPHPMILGGITGWLGFQKLAAFREAYPLYVPMHILFYTAHAIQEHFAIHTNGKLASAGADGVDAKKVK